MASNQNIDVEFNDLEQIIKALHEGVKKTVLESAKVIEHDMGDIIAAYGLVETGNMMYSPYVKMRDYTDYPEQGFQELLPEMEAPASDQEADIGPAAAYAVYQNYGTRYIPSHPFAEQAAKDEEEHFVESLSDLEEVLKKGGYTPRR